jgi:hypothetical protein
MGSSEKNRTIMKMKNPAAGAVKMHPKVFVS